MWEQELSKKWLSEKKVAESVAVTILPKKVLLKHMTWKFRVNSNIFSKGENKQFWCTYILSKDNCCHKKKSCYCILRFVEKRYSTLLWVNLQKKKHSIFSGEWIYLNNISVCWGINVGESSTLSWRAGKLLSEGMAKLFSTRRLPKRAGTLAG